MVAEAVYVGKKTPIRVSVAMVVYTLKALARSIRQNENTKI